MYAVVKTGSKQYRVAEGDTVKVEKLDGDPGAQIQLTDVLMLVDGDTVQLGRPTLKGATVKAEIVAQDKHPKVITFKYRRRHRYRRKVGHRQPFTELKITSIKA